MNPVFENFQRQAWDAERTLERARASMCHCLKRERERRRLSVREAAKFIGVDPSNLSKVENGKWLTPVVLKAAEYYEKSEWEYFSELPDHERDADRWLRHGDVIQHVAGTGPLFQVFLVRDGDVHAKNLEQRNDFTRVINIVNWRRRRRAA